VINAEQQHEAEKFVRALLGDRDAAVSGLWVTLWTWPDRMARWLPAHDAGAIASAVTGLAVKDGVEAVYIGIGFQGNPKGRDGTRTRGAADDVIGLIGIATDIDIAGPAHTDKHAYPPDPAAARRVVDSMGLPPTLLIDSGHGLQAWWTFTEPVIFGQVDQLDDGTPIVDDSRVDVDRARYADLLWSWTTTMRVNARTLGGWHIDPTGDIARVLRPAGSANRKVEGDTRRVSIVEHTPTATYEADDFTPYILERRALDEMRMAGREETTGALKGVDVHAVYARVRSGIYAEFKHYPPWLRDMIEMDKDFGDGKSRIEDTFLGRRPDLGGDQSALDASLTRLLADLEMDAESIVEAVMCRRIRSGVKIDKIDPNRRTDYLSNTVGRFIVESRIKREQLEAHAVEVDTSYDDAVAAARAGLPVIYEVEEQAERREPETPVPEIASVGDVEPPETDPADDVADDAPFVEQEEPPAPAKPKPAGPDRNLVDEVADGGTGDIVDTPPPPDDKQVAALKRVTVMLALPTGFRIWRAEFRQAAKADQMRLWIHRETTTEPVVGIDAWVAGGLAVTKWHAKPTWEKGGEITGHLRRDLHLFCGKPAKEWLSDGLPLLYAVLIEVRTGTPREALRAGVRDLLTGGSAPVESLAAARDHGVPWLMADAPPARPQVCVAVGVLRKHMVQMGETVPPTPEEVITMAASMGCVVHTGVRNVEEHRTVRDARTWITIASGLLGAEDWEEVRNRIVEHKEQQARASNVVPIRRSVG
jgi:hypothetical protein